MIRLIALHQGPISSNSGWGLDAADVLLLITAVTTLASVLALVWSVLILRRQLQAQGHQAVQLHQKDVDVFMFDHIELKHHIESGLGIPEHNPLLKMQLLACAEIFASHLTHVWLQLPSMSRSEQDGWKEYMRDMAAKPTIDYYLHWREKWYAPEFVAFLRGG